jgi:hypothetical protein
MLAPLKVEVRMKNLFLLCVVVSLYSCVKVQKKSELDQPQDQRVQVMAEQVREPVIFILDEVKSLTEDTLIIADEVYLKSNARIYTNQFALNIQATSIFVDRGVFIQTFADQQLVAPIEVQAIDGGVVHIVANDIHGNLQVFMNGQEGGPGLGGWTALPPDPNPYVPYPGREACQPNSGKNSGVSGSFFLEVNQSQDFSVSTSMKVAAGGALGEISPLVLIYIKDADKKYKTKQQQNCYVVPTTGKVGIPGQICLKLSATDLAKCERF